ncbi:phage tail tape measure protein [Labrys portucalensis]|uniref:Phage tail tape measure protein n=1 Tax=Labrys neptuniae TaxID=376174 RepID=A0ABV6ZJZ4_9HYPH
MVNIVSTLTARLIDQISGPAKGATAAVNKLSVAEKALARLEAQAGKTAALKGQVEELAKAKRAFIAQKQVVIDLAKANAKAGTISEAMANKLASARDKLKSLGAAMESNKIAVMATKRGLEQIIGPVNSLASAEAKLAAHVSRANAALKQQAAAEKAAAAAAARSARRRDAFGTMGGAVAGYAAYRGTGLFMSSIEKAAEFDIARRKMRITQDLKEGDDASLVAQAKRIGQQTQFSNTDVIYAQTKAMQGLPPTFGPRLKAEVAEGILENVKNYSTLMDSDLADGAETIRTYLNTTRRDISSKEKALAEANRATNMIFKMAKLGGMSNDDVQGYLRFALPSATAAGVDPEAALAIGAILRRGGYRGEEAGVAMRNFSNKMLVPTADGRAALTAAGLDYNNYVRRGGAIDPSRLMTHLGNTLGTKATPELQAALARIAADKALTKDPAKFQSAVADAIEGPARKGKGGNTANRKKVSKAAGKFLDMSAEGVDVQRMLDDLMNSKMTLAQLNALFSGKFGGKFSMTQEDRDQYIASRKIIGDAANDPDLAAKKATEVMAGLGGSLENLKGSVDNVIQSFGEANANWMKIVMDGTGKALDGLSNLGDTAKTAATALGLVAAAVGFTKGTGAVLGGLFGKGGGAEALVGSATALDGSAAALTRAAGVLGGKGVIEDLPGKDSPGKNKGGVLNRLAGLAAVVAGLIGAGQEFAAGDADYNERVKANGGRPPSVYGKGAVNWNVGRKRNPFAPGQPGVLDPTSGPTVEQPKVPYGALTRDPSLHGEALANGSYSGAVSAAQNAGLQIKEALSPTAAPTIDTSGLQAAVALAERFLSLMRSAGAAAINTSHLAPKAVPAPMTNPAYGKGD